MATSRLSLVDELVRAALEGDRTAFDRLYDLAFSAVWRAALENGREGAETATADWLRRAFADRLAGQLAPPAMEDLGPAKELDRVLVPPLGAR